MKVMCSLSDDNVKKWRELMGNALEYILELENQIEPEKNHMLTKQEKEDAPWKM